MESPSSEAEVTIKSNCFQYDEETNTYIIKLSDAVLVSHDLNSKEISFRISSKKVDKNNNHIKHSKDISEIINDVDDDDKMEFMLDEIEMENDQHIAQQKRRSSSSLNHHTILSDIVSEWNLNVNTTKDDDSKQSEMMQCRGQTVKHKHCKPIKRIQFILKYYSEWIHLKYSAQMQQEQADMIPSPSFSAAPSPRKVRKYYISFLMINNVCTANDNDLFELILAERVTASKEYK